MIIDATLPDEDAFPADEPVALVAGAGRDGMTRHVFVPAPLRLRETPSSALWDEHNLPF